MYPHKPNVDPNPSNNLQGHYFEKQLIQDMRVHLALSNRISPSDGGPSSTSGPVNGKKNSDKLIKSCFHCRKSLWKICVVMLVDIFKGMRLVPPEQLY